MSTSRDVLEASVDRGPELVNVHHSDGHVDNTRTKEIVAWILIVVLAVVTAAAFYALWLKTAETENRIGFRSAGIGSRQTINRAEGELS